MPIASWTITIISWTNPAAFLLAALLYPPAGILLLGAIGGVGLVDYRVRKPSKSLPAFYLYHFLEQLAYGTGVFWGCLRMKSFSCYRLDLHNVNATA